MNLSLYGLVDLNIPGFEGTSTRETYVFRIKGDEFRAVKLEKDSVRGGLLGQAGILAMGGDGEKSLPIKRGAFVVSKLLDTPPASPTPNVPLLKADGIKSTRALFEAHTQNAACTAGTGRPVTETIKEHTDQ